jgi:hypothetical protein
MLDRNERVGAGRCLDRSTVGQYIERAMCINQWHDESGRRRLSLILFSPSPAFEALR